MPREQILPEAALLGSDSRTTPHLLTQFPTPQFHLGKPPCTASFACRSPLGHREGFDGGLSWLLLPDQRCPFR